MCTLVILRRPGHPWPLLLAANRDEMDNRPWLPPGRHWPDRDDVVAGRDGLAGGTWLGLNEDGVVAAILNRINTLGPAPGMRSRGELPLEALDNGDARSAADALAHLNPAAYRPFNMIVADTAQGFWIRAVDGGNGGSVTLRAREGINTLADFRIVRTFRAENGQPAEPRRNQSRHGPPQGRRSGSQLHGGHAPSVLGLA